MTATAASLLGLHLCFAFRPFTAFLVSCWRALRALIRLLRWPQNPARIRCRVKSQVRHWFIFRFGRDPGLLLPAP
jgi:hypothetical protein